MTRSVMISALLLLCVLTLCCVSFAQDSEPAKDHPSVPRFPGMGMSAGKVTDFDGVDFQISTTGEMKHVEGRSWQYTYDRTEGARQASPLEIARNYLNQFKARGGKLVWQQLASDGGAATMVMPLGTGERWLSLMINNNGDQMMMAIIETGEMKQKIEFSADEMADQVTATGKITLHGILFDTAKTDIKPESNAVLDEVTSLLQKHPEMKFSVEGHTDNVGAKASNLTLSRGRAAAVKAALVSRGIAAGRLTSDGFGDTKPVADNTAEEGRAQNRRVELVKR